MALRTSGFGLLLLFFYYTPPSLAQNTFWTEDFGTGPSCEQAAHPDGFTSANGAWTVTDNSSGSTPNIWYVSSQELGMSEGDCGAGCTSIFRRTAHIGNDPNSTGAGFFCPSGDCGAAYDESTTAEATDKRFESPTIDCSGRSNIELEFLYIMNGEASVDRMRVYYFDGSSWSNISDPAQTNICGSGQGEWTKHSVSLPASADNNPNVKLGFQWENNGDGAGGDPSVAIDSISLLEPASPSGPTADFDISDSTLCEGDCIGLTDLSSADSIESWDWDLPGTTPDSSDQKNPSNICYDSAGTFDVTLVISDTSGQKDTLSKSDLVEVFPNPTADAGPDQDICAGDSTQLNGSGGGSYSWSPADGLSDSSIADPQASPTDSTLYELVVTDMNGCSDTDSVMLDVHSVTADAGTDQELCEGNSAQLQASGGDSYDWTPGSSLDDSTVADPLASPDDSTQYVVTVTDSNGCSDRDTTPVHVKPSPTVNAGPDKITEAGEAVTLDGSGSGSFSWDPSGPLDCSTCENPSASVEEDTDFVLTVTNGLGCTATDTMQVLVKEDSSGSGTAGDIFIPNVFAPNGNGAEENREFRVLGDGIRDIRVLVFNRWGELVFESEDPQEGWDGTHNGEALEPGVFFYKVNLTLQNGEDKSFEGDVTILQ